MADTIRTVRQLLDRGFIAAEDRAAIERVCAQFALAITSDMAALIEPGRAADPITKQFVPDPRELDVLDREIADPIGDARFTPVKGIVHRHRDRVLLKPTHICAVYCRFCFRREQLGGGNLTAGELDAALGYVRAHPEIWEVILSGGDPFVLAPHKLGAMLRALDAITHVGIVRIHTRVPVVAPDRIGRDLLRALAIEKPVYIVLHVNHARELTLEARAAIRALAGAGIALLSQSVLLKGVNDNADALRDLFKALLENRVKPYYLHHGDLARGTAHFRTDIAAGQELMRALRRDVSGLAQPHYVLDIPGGSGKVPVGPNYLTASPEGMVVEDHEGRPHHYPE